MYEANTFPSAARSPEVKVIEVEENEDWLTSTAVQLDRCKSSVLNEVAVISLSDVNYVNLLVTIYGLLAVNCTFA